jgi:hypothetical protein
MELPILYPNPQEKIVEDVARFRALSPAERIEEIRRVIDAGEQMIRNSPDAESIREYHRQQKEIARQAFRDLVKRHGL